LSVCQKQVLVLLGLVCLGDSAGLAFVLSMYAFLVPIGDEGACMEEGVP
jgi:hypothetical protein